jgi:16S rRNA (cytosine967-C5)-methyltransferase
MPAKTLNARISPARAAAFQVLLEISRSSSAHSDDLLQSAAVDALSPQDRNLCMALTMGVLRWQLALDARIAPLLTHSSKLDEPVRTALRLGAFQLLLLDRVPAHAAISDSVELTKRAGHRFASGLVNAVLRKLAIAARSPIGPAEAHPAWLVQRWSKGYGEEATLGICAYDQQPAESCLRVLTPEAEAALVAQGFATAPGHFLQQARRVLSGDVANSPAVRDGVVRIQDEGSQLIAELLSCTPRAGERVLDCCAAPGGKTAILAQRHPHSSILACDISAARVARMRELLLRAPIPLQIECRVTDAVALPPDERFDRILCDVPCSGTGTLARNPEIKLRLQPDDLVRQHERQMAILQSALRALTPGGELVYSTCSLEPEENEQVIEKVLAMQPGARLMPMKERIEALAKQGIVHQQGVELLLRKAVQGDFLRTIPGILPTDGFFAAILKRA